MSGSKTLNDSAKWYTLSFQSLLLKDLKISEKIYKQPQEDLKHDTWSTKAIIFPSVLWWEIKKKKKGWMPWAKEPLFIHIWWSLQWCRLMWACFRDATLAVRSQGCTDSICFTQGVCLRSFMAVTSEVLYLAFRNCPSTWEFIKILN